MTPDQLRKLIEKKAKPGKTLIAGTDLGEVVMTLFDLAPLFLELWEAADRCVYGDYDGIGANRLSKRKMVGILREALRRLEEA